MIRLLFALVGLSAVFGAVAPAADRPNLLVVLVDDLGWGDLSVMGATDLRTPHLDALFAGGLRCQQFYANCTVCTPTRASLLTGRYPAMAGAPGVIRQWPGDSWGYFRPGGPTLPETLRSAGYHTAMVGKWHLGFRSPNIPNERGFDHFHGFLGDMMDDYWTHLRGGENWMRRDREVIEPEGHATDLFTTWAADYIRGRVALSEPWFLYLAYNAPHFPIQPPPDWLAKVQARHPDLPEKRARNVAFIEHLDHGIGLVLTALRESGQEGDTVVVFSSDNGGSLPHAQSNGPLRGGKQDHWEGGIRVPTCVSWPGRIAPGVTESVGITMDLYPSLAELAGAAPILTPLDGRSLVPVWMGDRSLPGDDRTLFWHRREGGARYGGQDYYAVRRGPWKLLQNHPFEPLRLFHLGEDPGETTPVDRPAIFRELSGALRRHVQETGRVPWQPSLD